MKLTLLLCLAVFGAAVAFPSAGDAPPAESDEDNDVSSAPVDSPPDDDDDDDEEPISEPTEPTFAFDDDTFEYNSTTVEEPDAPAAIPEVALDYESLKVLVSEFSKYTNEGFETSELLKRISELESQIQRSTSKLSSEVEQENRKLGQLRFLLMQLGDIKSKISALQNNFRNLETGLSESGSFFPGVPSQSGGGSRSWATLYRSRGHSGRTTILDFRGCSAFEECCKNLEDLDNDSQSIHTHDTCVTMYDGRDCQGESRDFYPGSPTNHQDFGSYNDRFSSGKACNRS